MIAQPPGSPAPSARPPLVPVGVDLVTALILLAGFALLYLPTYAELARTIWASDEQGHGPIILAVSAWLLFARRHEIAAAPRRPMPLLGWSLLLLGGLLFALGSGQSIIMFQVGSQIVVIAALLLIFSGGAALKNCLLYTSRCV